MAIKVTQNVGQQAGQEAAARSQRQLSLRPKTVVERMIEAGPPSLEQQPVQTREGNIQELARQAAAGEIQLGDPKEKVQLPPERSGSPISPQDQQRMMQESRQRFEEAKYADMAAAQREEERVPALSETYDGITNDGFGESILRADKFSDLFQSKMEDTGATVGGAFLTQKETLGVGFAGASPEAVGINPLSTKGVLFDPQGFDAGKLREDGVTQVDPMFSRTMGMVTERFIASNQSFEADQEPDAFDQETNKMVDEEGEMRRGIGNAALGREIFRAWKREQNLAAGRPTDEYSEAGVANDQFEVLGTLAKEMYHSANPELYERTTNESEGNVKFKLTPAGQVALRAAEAAKPDAFIKQEIPPSTVPRPIAKRLGEGEARTIRKEKTTAVVNRRIQRVEEARDNMNSVGHIVDPLRRKIFTQLAMQALVDIKRGEALPKIGNLFNIGPEKFVSFQGEKKRKAMEGDDSYDPRFEMEKQIVRFLETMNTIGRYSNRVNHLDFVLQELQTRMHVAQTRFNPQGIPWMRFVTGGAKPSEIRKGSGSDAELMFKEMIAALMIPGAKKLLPDERVKAFDREWNSPNHGALSGYVTAGQSIANSLMDNDTDKKTTEMLGQITLEEKGINVPPALQSTPKLDVPESVLVEAMSEGLEGLNLIEAAHELYQYDANDRFHSNMGVEIDGKTHGPASNLMQIGVVKAAYRVGVLRSEGATKNLDDFTIAELYNGEMVEEDAQAGDIRDAMRDYILKHSQAYAENKMGNSDLAYKVHEIIKLAVQDRDNYLKKPPMTLAYGQLLKNLKGAVSDAVYSGKMAPKIRKLMADKELGNALADSAGPRETADDVMINILHDILADAIDAELHPDVVRIGQLLRANNVVAMLSDDIMVVKNAIGVDNYIGARQSMIKELKGNINVTLPSGRKAGGVPIYSSTPSGSALRQGKPGGWGRGRVIPAVIQGIDGAWMNKTFTRESWSDLKDSYMLPIMDAIKTDLASARKVRRHANRNWWNTIQEYSYVDEIMGTWAPKTIANFKQRLADMDPNQPIDVSMDSKYRAFGWLLDPAKGLDDTPFDNLVSTLYDTMDFPPRPKGQSVKAYEAVKRNTAKKIAKEYVIPQMYKQGESAPHLQQLTPKQMLDFFNRMMTALNIESRNTKTVKTVAENRANLFNMAKDSDILQIDIG